MTRELISPGYRMQLRRAHERAGWGNEGHLYRKPILEYARAIGAATILDYGCGKGTLRDSLPDSYDVREYDPGIPGKDDPPDFADLVVATDVLEHVEPDHLDAVLADMRELGRFGRFVIIACAPAREKLPDGRNAHLIVETPEWWVDRLCDAGWPHRRNQIIRRGKGVMVWA